jgi:periplasmic protein TonB
MEPAGQTDSGDPAIIGAATGDGVTFIAEPPVVISTIDINKPISNPEIMPQFPGGLIALKKFLERNLKNPRDLEEGEKISVKINFVVGYDGKLKSFQLQEDGGDEFNREVIRVLKRMPDWIPGKSGGQNVSVYYAIPVKFLAEE